MDKIVKRSRAGTYHLGHENGNVVNCNYRSGNYRAANEQEIAKASAASFCKKCFPNGKPV